MKALDVQVKGKETFNFKCNNRREDTSTRNAYVIFDHKFTLCKFHNESIAVGMYTFKF